MVMDGELNVGDKPIIKDRLACGGSRKAEN